MITDPPALTRVVCPNSTERDPLPDAIIVVAMLRLIWFLLGVVPVFAVEDVHRTLTIGSKAPGFSLPGIDGKTHSLGEYASSKLPAIVFTYNHRPTATV